jgi:hypothetical protein
MSRPIGVRTVQITPFASKIAVNARIRSSPVGPAVVRDDVDVMQRAAHEPSERFGVLRAIVDAVEHHVFEEHLAVGLRDVALAGAHQFRDGPLLVDRHDRGAHVVGRRVQRDREVHLHALIRERVDLRHDTDGRDRDVTVAEGEALRVVE